MATCKKCGGSGRVTCPRCKGTGEDPGGDSFMNPDGECTKCWGSKDINCPDCEGSGQAGGYPSSSSVSNSGGSSASGSGGEWGMTSSAPAIPPVSSLPPNFTGMAEEHIFPNGDIYKGEWYNGRPEGRGKKIFADGKVYEGDWVNDFPDGRGKMKLSNGAVYEGDFVKGRPHGKGKATEADGTVQEGKWKNGEFKGLFGFSSSSGSYSEPFGIILSIIISALVAVFSAAYLGSFLEKFIPFNPDIVEIAFAVVIFIVGMIICRSHKKGKIIKLAVILVGLIAIGIFGNKAMAKIKGAPQTTQTAVTQNAEITSNVNFRKGPSTDNEVIRQLKKGDKVTLTGEVSSGWTQITHNGETGWVSAEFLKVWEK